MLFVCTILLPQGLPTSSHHGSACRRSIVPSRYIMAGRPSRTVRSIILTSVLGPTQAVGRTIGALSDGKTQAVVAQCGGAKPDAFVAGNCPNLINCLYEHLEAATTAGFQSGGNIAALVPTILALIGALFATLYIASSTDGLRMSTSRACADWAHLATPRSCCLPF